MFITVMSAVNTQRPAAFLRPPLAEVSHKVLILCDSVFMAVHRWVEEGVPLEDDSMVGDNSSAVEADPEDGNPARLEATSRGGGSSSGGGGKVTDGDEERGVNACAGPTAARGDQPIRQVNGCFARSLASEAGERIR